MGGFKRRPTKPKTPEPKKARQEAGAGPSRRRGGRAAASGKRGQKRRSDEGDEEEEEVTTTRKHVLYDEDDDDVQGEYREEGGTLLDDIWIPPKYTRMAHEMKGERLIIEKIVCENFKSYGGVKEMGPFHKSFSAIVGPNGNGKSNIIDAMLFVFGYRASKIRCKKMSILIHKSELLPDVHSCAVTVHFVKVLDEGDEDTMTVVPNSKITVTRRVDRNNKSIYQLDGRPVLFHEVAAFLKTNGVDIVHNRFLILQGEVESISQMPPKRKTQHETGLLEFLEEVIGTKRYMKCLNQLETRVEELNFEREAKLHTVDIVEKELKDLKEPVSKAKDFLRSQNNLHRNKHKLYQEKIHATRHGMKDLEAEKKEAEDRLAKTIKELDAIKEVQAEKDKEFHGKEKTMKGLEHDATRLQKSIDSADSKFTKVQEQIQRDNTQRKKAMKEITAGEKEMEELEQIPLTTEKELKILEKRRADLDIAIEKEQETVKKEMTKVESQVEKLSAEKEELMKTFMELKKTRDTKKETNDVLQSELDVLKGQEETETRKLDTMRAELEELKNKIKQKEKEARSSLGNKVGALEEAITTKKNELTAVTEEEALAKPEMESTRAAYEDAHDIFQNSNTDDQIYKAFFAEKAKGRFAGLYGRLRDLATIDEKYNVAATVASGVWDHWVVDSEVTGEEAIIFLREAGLPFQNFQCLNKLQRYLGNARKSFTAPRNSHRLFDLIKISKPEVTAAFYKALGDTLVADNIDIGSEIAYARDNRSRVTTLAGELIDPSGQMTGGGRQKITGKLNGRMAARLERSITERDYRSLKDNMETAGKRYNELLARKQALETEIRNLSLQLRDIERKMDSSKTDLESMKTQINLKEKRVADQEQKVKDATLDPKVIQQKEKLVRKAVADFEAAAEPCAKAEAETKKVQDKLKILQGERIKEVRKNLDFSIEQRKKVIESFNKHSVALKNYPKNHQKVVNKLENLRTEKTRLETEMRELEATKKEMTEKGVEVADEMEKIKEEIVKAKAELQTLKKSMSEFNKKKAELDKDRVIQDNDLANSNGKYNEVAGKVNGLKKKMAELALEDIPQETVDPFQELTEEELEVLDVAALEEAIATETQSLKKQSPNLLVLEQYKTKLDEFMKKVSGLDEVTLKRDKFRTAYITTVLQRLSEFMGGFAIISCKLKEMFRMISMGGDAELELVDSTDPFSMGINICVRPARKAWKKISYLSGGEKTLASLALIFALHHFKPSPFYVMDEIDAALDFKNVSIIANYIKDRTKFTQFIIISLRSNMFELADSMLGVFKVDNMSFSIHLGISTLLTQLRSKFLEANRPFPLENEFQSNNRVYRRKEMEKMNEDKRQKAVKDGLFNAEFSLIDEEDEEDPLSQAQGSKGAPPVEEIKPLDISEIETQPVDISRIETQPGDISGIETQPVDISVKQEEDADVSNADGGAHQNTTEIEETEPVGENEEDVTGENEDVTCENEAEITGDDKIDASGEEDEADITGDDVTEEISTPAKRNQKDRVPESPGESDSDSAPEDVSSSRHDSSQYESANE